MKVSAAVRSEWEQRGYVVVRGLLNAAEQAHATRVVEQLVQVARAARPAPGTSSRLLARVLRPAGVAAAWTLPDGVTRTPELWPFVVHAGLLEWVRALLGPQACYLQHSDVHAGFSAVAWHRDNVARRYALGHDWDEHHEPYRLMRVAFYLSSASGQGARLGLVPGTHRVQAGPAHARNLRLERATRPWSQIHAWWRGDGLLQREADWVAAEPGDAILFDPRILHSGAVADESKRSLFVAYGVPNEHFERHAAYYRQARPELHYAAPSAAFLALLHEHAIAPAPVSLQRSGAGGHVPPRWQTLLGRRLRG
jgi:ectoine hydroxylase-related dioxygenase (phytanoyl-CoA dioxygenase family)